MGMATKTWDKKAIYHSELVKASQGGLAVKFNGKPRDSKYPGKPAFVGFKVYGEEGDGYTLNIENDEIRRVLEGVPENTWVSVRADGSRDTAWLAVEDMNGNYVNDAVPSGEIAQPQSGPPPMFPEDQQKRQSNVPAHPVSTNSDPVVQRAVAMTLAAVSGLEKGGVRVDSDAAARIYNTHFIQATR